MMINGFDINPLAGEMHLKEIEAEVRRARAGSRAPREARAVARRRTVVARVLEWWRDAGALRDAGTGMR